jgi:glycosyltransferase involved in cell wall biosynthesis
MRVGIYTEGASPASGGAYTLLKTIKDDIFSFDFDYEIYFFFNDSSFAPGKTIENKITNINMFSGKKSLFFKAFKKMIFILFKYRIELTLNKWLLKESVDLLWILGPYNLDITIPYVFTVWDLGHRMLPAFPEVSTQRWIWEDREKLYQKMLYKAAYIITGNETGKQEILSNYSVNPEKIYIIPFPIPNFCFDIDTQPNEDTIKVPFIFYPAQFWAHKNHIAIVEAVAWLRDSKNIIINCYFVGSDKGNMNYVKNSIKKYNLENQVFILGFVDQSRLIFLYKNALAMTFVSLMGPNNLPPLEAIALGCPLIVSNIPGHIEQMEGAGILVDATNPIEIGEAILLIHTSPGIRNKLLADGHKFAEKYKNYSYFEKMLKLITTYSLYQKTWKTP